IVLAASAGRHTGIVGQRFLLGGVAVAALGTAVVTQLIARLTLSDAQEAAVWTVGSLSGASDQRITWLVVTLILLVPVGAWLHSVWARCSPRPPRLWRDRSRSSPCCPPPSRRHSGAVGLDC